MMLNDVTRVWHTCPLFSVVAVLKAKESTREESVFLCTSSFVREEYSRMGKLGDTTTEIGACGKLGQFTLIIINLFFIVS